LFIVMSEEQLKAFLRAVKGDATLEERFQAAADLDAIVAIAQEAGFAISKAEWMTQEQELSDSELEAVTGAAARRVRIASTLGTVTNCTQEGVCE
jgi:predicted ribosomally synthesized peptide with nif11-like leader